ncbi:7 transmembrane receptor (Secretin family) [Popillia japonica]|uniref:7 transmembrane receptor (Secretin family) n=1 Tax=Popillia japonica TaxID=7064 RepID=A0AAW1LXH2_POPJA
MVSYAVFIDFKKAYDSIKRNKILKVLQEFNIDEVRKKCVLDKDNDHHIRIYEEWLNLSDNFDYVPGIECSDIYYQDPITNPKDVFLILKNGLMHIIPPNVFINASAYCLDYFENKGICAIVCFPSDNENVLTTQFKPLGMIISMPFLLATFLVYALLPDRNLPAKALMCYVLSLLFAYILLVTIQLNNVLDSGPCKTLAFFCYFFFMASFFWMNASCLDIFFTFSGIRGLLGEKKKENRRFMYYSAYAWGIPVLMVGFAAIFTFEKTDNLTWATGIGDGQCWFRNGWPTGIYFYFPIATLLIVNIVLFSITTYKIKRVQHDTKMLKNVDSRKNRKYDNNDKQRFNLYVKLLFAMGINWSMEVVSWAIMWKWSDVPEYVWVLTDFCNAVYGVFIFFIFVFKRNIWMMLKKRYLQFTGRPQQAHTLTSVNRTTVSQVSSSEA